LRKILRFTQDDKKKAIMAIAINSSELMTLLEVTPSWQNIMLTGRHGIGKSQILTKYFETQGMSPQRLIQQSHIDNQ